MKILKFIIAITLLTTFCSCNDWLSLNPKDQIDEDKLFATGTGYRNALNGIYQNMASKSMYGREMTWGALDILGQYYNSSKLHSDGAWRPLAESYDYKDEKSKALIDNLWSKTFNAIANANNLLSRIDDEDPLKFAGDQLEKNVIKGEALALRAFLHFDMVRLFAPYKDDSKSYVPYFEKYPSTFEGSLTVNVLMEKVIRDLEAARDLVAPFDTIDDRTLKMHPIYRFTMGAANDDDFGNGMDLFEAYRGFRMNYYAINAVLARAYAYIGKYQEAFEKTQILIDAKDINGDFLFPFTSVEKVSQNPKLFYDLIFAVSNEDLPNDYDKYYNTKDNSLFLKIDYKEEMFDDKSDYRGEKLVATIDDWWFRSLKYTQPSVSSAESDYCNIMLPMIRISEMYYIRAEYYAHKGMYPEATAELDAVRRGRNCTIGRLSIDSEESFNTELLNEAKREFVGEGQLWFYYKKLDIKPDRNMPDGAFILPLPESETVN